MNIGKAIKLVMQAKKVKQKTLAKQTGLSETSISQLLNGSYLPKKSNLNKISKALKTPIPVFLVLSMEQKDFPNKTGATFNLLFPLIQQLTEKINGN